MFAGFLDLPDGLADLIPSIAAVLEHDGTGAAVLQNVPRLVDAPLRFVVPGGVGGALMDGERFIPGSLLQCTAAGDERFQLRRHALDVVADLQAFLVGTCLTTQKLQPGVAFLEATVECMHLADDVPILPCLRAMDALACGVRGIVVETKEEPSRKNIVVVARGDLDADAIHKGRSADDPCEMTRQGLLSPFGDIGGDRLGILPPAFQGPFRATVE